MFSLHVGSCCRAASMAATVMAGVTAAAMSAASDLDGQLKDVREALCKQAVHNQRTEDSFTLVKQDVESVRKEALDAVKMEAERRCCGDNSIVTYVNATFYPKQVADVTTGTATTAQSLYNPIPKCGCCNG